MKQEICRVLSNRRIARDLYEMRLTADTLPLTAPGQFVNLRLDGLFLRRPLCACDWRDGEMTLVYKAVGAGTQQLSRLAPGDSLDALVGLGNGFDPHKAGERPLLVGGGAGVPALYRLARELKRAGRAATAILGFGRAEEVFYAGEFGNVCRRVIVTTADGSAGRRGLVTDAMPMAGEYSYVYACGPEPMLKAVCEASATNGQFSFEERMGCGFGACMGCSCKTKYGSKRICADGPVLEKEEIVW